MSVGKSIPRVDAYEKVTGRAKFTDDLILDKCLVAKVLHAKIGNGWVKSIDTSAAEALDGVVKVVTFKDVPDVKFPTPGHPWSVEKAHQDRCDRNLLTQRIRYYGDDIAAVIAVDDVTAAKALRLIKVVYEELPVQTDPELAMKPGAMLVHDDCAGNIAGQNAYEIGHVDEAMKAADVVAEGAYKTQIVQHCHLEAPISYAYMEKDKIVVVASTQIPHIVRRVCGQALGIPWGRIRIIKPYIGGGFGNKQDVLYEPLNAFLTTQVGGRCVKLDISREETFASTRTRHALQFKMQAGLKRDGKMIAKDMSIISNQGAYTSHGHSIAANGATSWRHLYDVENIRANAVTVYTNIAVAGAMRGYGIPQFCFAQEAFMDDIAVKLSMDPLEFRLKNIRRGTYADPYFKEIAANSNGLVECIEKGRSYIKWDEKRKAYAGQTGSIRRGVGMAVFSYKTGIYPLTLEVAGARLVLNQDGSANLMVGATEIGQGADTAFSQIASEASGIPVERIYIESTQDTDISPFDTGAYASRQTYVTGLAVKECALQFKKKILDYARTLEHLSDEADIIEGVITDGGKKVMEVERVAMESYYSLTNAGAITSDISHQIKSNALSFGCCFAEVEVDINYGKVKIIDIINVHDSGRLINPQLAQMQIHGGMSMGIGYALSEQLLIDKKTGKMLNGTLLDYKLPTMMDAPDLHVEFVEADDPTGPYGNKSLGEPPAIPGGAAIRNAVLNATGVAINELPLSPQRCFEAFKAAGLIKEG